MNSNNNNIAVGDHVGYSVDFLWSIGATTGDLPHRRGHVKQLLSLGTMLIAVVEWIGDKEPRKVNANNLARVGTVAFNERTRVQL